MTKYFRSVDNKYVGGFDGAEPPEGSIEVAEPPKDGRMIWNGTQWIDDPALEAKLVKESKKKEALSKGISVEDKVDALWARFVVGKADATDAIKTVLDQIDSDAKKP